MAVKAVKVCKKVNMRRDAVSGHSSAPVLYSPRPRTIVVSPWPISDLVRGAPPATFRPLSPMSPDESEDPPKTESPNTSSMQDRETASSENQSLQNVEADDMDYQKLTVDWILDSHYDEVNKLLTRLHVLYDINLIQEVQLHFTVAIIGLPECLDEDVFLAVYFFIEEKLKIKSRLLICRKIWTCNRKMVVGVMFDTIRMKYDVLNRRELLEGTGVTIVHNKTMSWVGETQ